MLYNEHCLLHCIQWQPHVFSASACSSYLSPHLSSLRAMIQQVYQIYVFKDGVHACLRWSCNWMIHMAMQRALIEIIKKTRDTWSLSWAFSHFYSPNFARSRFLPISSFFHRVWESCWRWIPLFFLFLLFLHLDDAPPLVVVYVPSRLPLPARDSPPPFCQRSAAAGPASPAQ